MGMAKTEAASNTQQVESDKCEAEKTIKLLELELASREKMKELEDAKKAAQAAAEAAKKALEDSKRMEKEAQEALKSSLMEQNKKEAEAMREHADVDKLGSDARKEKKVADKVAAKEVLTELSQIEKARLQREKNRQQKYREPAGFGKGGGRGLKALTMGGGTSPAKRAAPSTENGTPNKVAKVVLDVD